MLFDLEDYRVSGIVGKDHVHVHQIRWDDAAYAFRATFDAYYNTIREYGEAAVGMAPASEVSTILEKSFIAVEKLSSFGKISKDFWNAMCSIAIVGSYNEGDRFNYTTVYINDVVDGVDYQDLTWTDDKRIMNPYKFVAFRNENGEFEYRTMDQALYNSYYTALTESQSAVKELMLTGEGVTTFEEFVPPLVPAWNDTAELSGYVRDSRSLPISGAIVRLVDADGINHDLVTDELGYYHFTKEYIYNNISFGTASSVEFDMFVLEEKTDGVVLYDQTSIFQNSFFGAVNNRDFTWPVLVKSGKPNRRNFKLEFITDYSNYPSFSGYVKDTAGNPIKDAFVQIKDSFTGYSIGQYLKSNGDIAMNFKYNDFGVDRTILTDENGFYEYTSQMVGEWFNKQLMRIGDTPGKLSGRTFDEYFGSREDLISFYDSFSGRNLQYKESFFALLIPYKQDADSSEISWNGQSIYDQNDYYTSRFKYALNPYGEFQYQRIDLNAHYDIDVDVAVATNDEFRADKFTVELLVERKNIDGGLSSQTYVNTTSGYFKVVYPATGESYVGNSGSWYYTYWHLSINYNNADDYKDFYIYSCDSQGRAMGYIMDINTPSFAKAIDLSGLRYIKVFNPINFYGESLDFSGLEYIQDIHINYSDSLKNVIGLESKRLTNLSLFRLYKLESIDVSELTNLYSISLQYLPKLQSLDIHSNTNLEYLQITNTDIVLDVTGLTRLNNVHFDKLTMTSDDVDDLLNQLASMAPNQLGENVSYGYVNINRISRSSYSDDAYATLMQRNWNIYLGDYFYDEEIIPNKLIIEFDPSLASSNLSIDMNQPSIQTTTGYWIGRLWTGELFGNIGSYGDFYVNSGSISGGMVLGTTLARFEIFSCNQYGVPEGEITSIQLNHPKIKSVDTSELSELEHFDIYYYSGSGSPYSTIGSLDFTQNHNLRLVNISGSNVESIDLTGLISLENLTFSHCPNLGQITGFSSLSSLNNFGIERMPNLGYTSLAGLENLRYVYVNESDLYDSTHVDTMLAELNVNVENFLSELIDLIALKQTERDVKLAELSTFDAQEPTISTLSTELDTLYTELNQLISDGADQSLIDSKQAEVNTKSAELSAKEVDRKFLYNQVDTLDSEIISLNNQVSETFSGANFNTNYMARTSASDADYDSLIAYGWNLNIGSEFIAPYTAPVKGFVTYDWTYDQSSDNYFYFDNILRFSSTTGYVKYVSGIYSGIIQVSSDIYSPLTIRGNIAKGGLEFWSCDSHGRPSGNITAFSHTNGYGQWLKSFDISNLTEIKYLDLFVWQAAITSIDLSSNTNIERLYITYFSNLESIVGFQGLVNLKEVSISEAKKLDLPVDFTPFTNLQSMTLWDLGVGKNSRLDISGLDKLQYFQAKWTYLLSEDLDNALMALDAAGLNSESDFAYEGHLDSVGPQLYLNFGMGIGRHAIADAAYASLQSKGWGLITGNQIIDSIEDPVKGIARWGASTSWAALSFSYINGRSVMAKYPDGRIENVSMISFSFDSSIPVEDRFIEFWEVDDYGRPRHGGITQINDWWSTGLTSLEVNNLTGIESIYMQFMGTQLDFSGMPNLRDVSLNNSENLQNLILDGCGKIRNIYLNSCPVINLDQVIESLGTIDFQTNFGYYQLYSDRQRTNASDSASDYLKSRGWNLNVFEPAGDTVLFNVTAGQSVRFNLSCSSGQSKVTFPTGSDMYNQYPNGYIIYGKYDAPGYFQTGELSFYADFTGQISIKGVAQYNGTWIDSGEIRFIDNREQGSFVVSTLSKVRSLKIVESYNFTTSSWFNQNKTSIANLELDRIELATLGSVTSLNLSTFKAKELIIVNAPELNQLILSNQLLSLNINGAPNLTSLNLNENLKSLALDNVGIETISSWPSNLSGIGIYNSPISEISNLTSSSDLAMGLGYLNNISSLDLSNIKLKSLELTNISLNSGIDISHQMNMGNINLSNVNVPSIDLTGTTASSLYLNNLNQGTDSPILTGLETASISYIDIVNWKSPDFTINDKLINFNLYPTVDSETISIAVNGSGLPGYICIEGQNLNFSSLTSMTLPNSTNLVFSNFSGLSHFDCSAISNPNSRLTINNIGMSTLDVAGFNGGYLRIQWSNAITSITGLSNASMKELNLSYLYNLGTIDLSGCVISKKLQLEACIGLHVTGLANPNVDIEITYCPDINLSGLTCKTLNSWWTSGSINLSNMTISSDAAIYGHGFRNTSGVMNLDGINVPVLNITYCTSGYDYWGNPGSTYYSISLVDAVIGDSLWIYYHKNLSSINAAGSSIKSFYLNDVGRLTNFAASLKGTNNMYINLWSSMGQVTINSINLTDAELNTSLNNGIYIFGAPLSTNVVDSVINAVSQSNLTSRSLHLANMSSKSSASQVAYDKLIGQSWNMINR